MDQAAGKSSLATNKSAVTGEQPNLEIFRWLTSLLIVMAIYAALFAWVLITEHPSSTATPPVTTMAIELVSAPVAPASQTDRMLEPEPGNAKPSLPDLQQELKQQPTSAPSALLTTNSGAVLKPEPEMPQKIEVMQEESPVHHEEETVVAASSQSIVEVAPQSDTVLRWQSGLMLRLNNARRYPIQARRSKQQGVTYLHFTMDREGNVLTKTIERSAGHSLLDKEALALIDRAEPLPKPPLEIQEEVLEFIVPVEFSLTH